VALYSSSTVIAARQSHVENKRERRKGRRREKKRQKSGEGIEHFSLITYSSSDNDIIKKK
jgi:hypothetical protein